MVREDQATIFQHYPIGCAVSSAIDGNMSFRVGPNEQVVAANISGFVQQHGVRPEDVYGLRIEYDDRSYDAIIDFTIQRDDINVTDYSKWVAGDAIVLTTPGKGIFLPIADCNGIVIYDTVKNILALAHVGWHASYDDLPQKLITYLQDKHDCDPARLLVYFTPSIKRDKYIVQQPRQLDKEKWLPYLVPASESGYHVDLVGFIKNQLIENGVEQSNIEVSQVDTATSDEYFSHYLARLNLEASPRFGVLAWLKKSDSSVAQNHEHPLH